MVWVEQVYRIQHTNVRPDASTAPMTMAKLKNPMKQSFDKLNQDVKELHSAINNYSKALDKVRCDVPQSKGHRRLMLYCRSSRLWSFQRHRMTRSHHIHN